MKKCAYAILLCALTTPTPPTQTSNPHAAIAGQSRAEKGKMSSTALNHFGLNLAADIAAHDRHKNLFVSPLSLFLALAMTESGAEGETRAAMRKALAVPPDMSEESLHQSASSLMKSLESQKGIELTIANALWSDTKLPLSPDFVARCQKLYDAEAGTLDFTAPKAVADTINGWVKKKTRDKIPDIVTAENVADSRAILTNAVYFRGRWEHQFPKSQTQDAPFHLTNGGEKKVPMMHLASIKGAYRGGNGYEAAVLPYESSDVALYAILPAPGHSPEELLTTLSVDELNAASGPNDLDLKFPRFTLDFGPANLKASLTSMGMGPAFETRREFTPMGSPLFFIGAVLHRTRLEVDEEGTVAAAATAVMMAPKAMPPQKLPKKTLVFDRPFALLLCDTRTGAVLFAGVIYDPGS
jgi:serpin B